MSSFALPIVVALTSLLIILVSCRLLKPFSLVTWNDKPVNGFAGFLLTTIGLFVAMSVGLFVMTLLALLLIGIPFFVMMVILFVFVAIILFLLLSPLLILFLLMFGIGSKTISSFSNKK